MKTTSRNNRIIWDTPTDWRGASLYGEVDKWICDAPHKCDDFRDQQSITKQIAELYSKSFVSRAEHQEVLIKCARLEKAIQRLEQVCFGRGVEKIPGVCGGVACIVRTRIPIWMLEAFRRDGLTDAVILDSYPTINAADLANAWAYVAFNKDEIDADIRANDFDE